MRSPRAPAQQITQEQFGPTLLYDIVIKLLLNKAIEMYMDNLDEQDREDLL